MFLGPERQITSDLKKKGFLHVRDILYHMTGNESRKTELNAKRIKKHNCTSTTLYGLLLIHVNILNTTRHVTMSQMLQDGIVQASVNQGGRQTYKTTVCHSSSLSLSINYSTGT